MDIIISQIDMAYQQVHGINQFIPNYVAKSDYLPTRVVDGSNTQTSTLVLVLLILAPPI